LLSPRLTGRAWGFASAGPSSGHMALEGGRHLGPASSEPTFITDLLIFGANLVPLLVPLCTGIWCFLAPRSAIWKSQVSVCNKRPYSRQCGCVQGGAGRPKFRLKIRRPQGRGGSSPPPGTRQASRNQGYPLFLHMYRRKRPLHEVFSRYQLDTTLDYAE
jgi:hypothetical protein